MAQLTDSERTQVQRVLEGIQTIANLVPDMSPDSMRRVQSELTSAVSELRKQLDLDSDV